MHHDDLGMVRVGLPLVWPRADVCIVAPWSPDGAVSGSLTAWMVES